MEVRDVQIAGIAAVRGAWEGSLRVRHLGPYPLLPDNSQRARSETVVNLRGAYRINRTQLYAELFNVPETPVPVYVSAFGPKAIALAARIGDGYVGTAPDAELVASYTEQAGADKPRLATGKCCWASDEGQARKLAHRLWPNLALPGELAQELPTPAHFAQAAALVTEDMIGETIPCGPDPERYVESVREYADAGYTELYLHNIGDDQDGFIDFFQREVRPRLG